MEKLQFISEIGKCETMDAGGIKLVVYTNELSPDEMAKLMTLRGKQGMMLFKEGVSNYTEEEVSALPDPELSEKSNKTDSQRLRDVIWLYGFQQGIYKEGDKAQAKLYYAKSMDKLINDIKSKLTP